MKPARERREETGCPGDADRVQKGEESGAFRCDGILRLSYPSLMNTRPSTGNPEVLLLDRSFHPTTGCLALERNKVQTLTVIAFVLTRVLPIDDERYRTRSA